VLARRSSIARNIVLSDPCPHIWLRCQCHQHQRKCVVEQPVRSLARSVAGTISGKEVQCGEFDTLFKISLDVHIQTRRTGRSFLLHILSVGLSLKMFVISTVSAKFVFLDELRFPGDQSIGTCSGYPTSPFPHRLCHTRDNFPWYSSQRKLYDFFRKCGSPCFSDRPR
jgi:hypothetical protein